MQRNPRWGNPTQRDKDYEQSHRGDSRTPSLIFSIVFFAAIVILAVFQNDNILLVLVLYFCILLEGVSVSAFIFYSTNLEIEPPAFESTDRARQSSPKGTDVVSSMNIYVTYAVRGSDHSRREIAYIIKNLLEEREIRKSEDTNDPLLQSDLRKVVYGYTEDNSAHARTRKKQTKNERESYLASLERVVARLRFDGLPSQIG